MSRELFTLASIPEQIECEVVTTGTAVVDTPDLAELKVGSVCIDTRSLERDSLFVALPGQRTDGHAFLAQAFSKGAVAALVRREWWKERGEHLTRWVDRAILFVVDDPLSAMQQLAIRYIDRFPGITRIGITGSNGKTTTKELLAAVLASVAETAYSSGNFNSEIGVPLSVFGLTGEERYAVFEMAMNNPGEMELLARIVRPHYGIITNIGSAHIGQLGSRDAIAAEKKAIFSQFDGTQIALLPREDEYFDYLSRDIRGTVVPYGPKDLPGLKDSHLRGVEGSALLFSEGTVRLHIPGAHNIHNALAAIRCCQLLGVSFSAIQSGIEAVRVSFGRGEIIAGEVAIIQDCYNSSPESVRAAAELLKEAEGRRVAVLGAMKELGEFSRAAHLTAAREVLESGVDRLFLFGEEFSEAVAALEEEKRVSYTDSYETLQEQVLDYIAPGDTVLLKASRSVELERLTPVIRGEAIGA
ncbi:MAG: UDP-N-acetylmuramoyl-tripeptide--D-alanyl-D-alanine ligase [Alkalispirochaetaceae bacterium]